MIIHNYFIYAIQKTIIYYFLLLSFSFKINMTFKCYMKLLDSFGFILLTLVILTFLRRHNDFRYQMILITLITTTVQNEKQVLNYSFWHQTPGAQDNVDMWQIKQDYTNEDPKDSILSKQNTKKIIEYQCQCLYPFWKFLHILNEWLVWKWSMLCDVFNFNCTSFKFKFLKKKTYH